MTVVSKSVPDRLSSSTKSAEQKATFGATVTLNDISNKNSRI